MMKRSYLLFFLLFMTVTQAEANFLTARCTAKYPEAMLYLQDQLTQRGYTVSRIQFVDKGLKARGYETLRYRVVFFGKPDEIELIKSEHPHLIPYFPLNITLHEQKTFIGMSSLDPADIHKLYPDNPLQNQFERWSKDVNAIVNNFKNCSEHH